MANYKITDLTAAASIVAADLFEVVTDVAGTPTSKKATAQKVLDLVGGTYATKVTPTFTTSITISKTVSGTADLNFSAPDRPTTGKVSLDWTNGTMVVDAPDDEVVLKRQGSIALKTDNGGIRIGPSTSASIKTGDGITFFNLLSGSPNLIRVTGNLSTISDNTHDWGYDDVGDPTLRPRNFSAGTAVRSPLFCQIDDAAADAATASSVTVRGRNKTAGTGNGGVLILQGGTSSGGTAGSVQIGAGSTTLQHALNTATGTAGTDILTLTNGVAGTAGNPQGYVKITVNGSTRYVPFW